MDKIVINHHVVKEETIYGSLKINNVIFDACAIENYLLDTQILYSFIPTKFNISYDDFINIFDTLLEEQKNSVFDSYATQYRIDCKVLDNGKQWEIATCNQHAREYLKEHWTSRDNKMSLVSGKNFLSILCDYFQANFNVCLTSKKIIDRFTLKTAPSEIVNFLNTITNN